MKNWKIKISLMLLFLAMLVCVKPAQAAGNVTVDGVEYGYRPKKESYVVVAVKEKLVAGSKVIVQSEIGGSLVKEIGAEAFSQGKRLQVYLPKSIKKIAKNAFGADPAKSVKTLCCVKNSAAQKYAGKHKIPCKKLSRILQGGEISQKALEISPPYQFSGNQSPRLDIWGIHGKISIHGILYTKCKGGQYEGNQAESSRKDQPGTGRGGETGRRLP